jgi:hypothetical protein
MSAKKSLEEQSSKLALSGSAWVEPMRIWINRANSICKISVDHDLLAKKLAAKEIFGSNLFLKNKKACLPDPKNPAFPLKNQWTALRAARQNSERFEKSFLMAELRRLRSNPVRDPY